MELEYQGQSSTSETTNKEKQVVIIDDNKNENDILPEFEEFLMNRDYIDGDTNVNKIELNVTDTFKDWNEVDIIVNRYAKQNGFVAIKSYKDLMPLIKRLFVTVSILVGNLESIHETKIKMVKSKWSYKKFIAEIIHETEIKMVKSKWSYKKFIAEIQN